MQFDIFSLFDKKELDKFLVKHAKKCNNNFDFDIKIRSTHLGIYCEIRCEDCLESIDVSDYEHW